MISLKNINIIYRRAWAEDVDFLLQYLLDLSQDSLKRFGPHRFDIDTLTNLYTMSCDHAGYIAIDQDTERIIAYAIIKKGFLEHDFNRLLSYGMVPDQHTDCTFAPSVADLYQGQGIGTNMFKFILSDLQKTTCRRIILWGGVQADNNRAIQYYLRNGFTILGEFQYNGKNYDMFYPIGK